MLPQLPIDVRLELPAVSEIAVPTLPPGLAAVVDTMAGSWTWVVAGAVLAVVSLWALRRARRMVVAAAVAVAGLLVAWNAGLLPLSA